MNKNESKYFNTAIKMDKAFLEILAKKEFSYITVKEICEKAKVNRSTFYLHYETMEDLLAESVEYMNQQFQEYMKQEESFFETNLQECSLEELYLITPKYLIPYLRYVREYKRLFLTMVRNSKILQLEESYERMFRVIFTPILERYNVAPDIRNYIMSFYIQGLMAIVDEWLKNDCKDSIEHIMFVIQLCVGQYKDNMEK